MNTINYKKLYSLSIDELDNIETENFLFQGSKNWDLYFEEIFLNNEVSEFEDVLLIDFTEKDEFEEYLKDNKVIDYSIEHFKELGKYFILLNNNG